ncbi:hypothetical protein [Rhizobium sp.]|uniref:hypothetical protein n=1 Tax=Rhizobium sp. TaxID=391 RepID=UPI000DD5B1A3
MTSADILLSVEKHMSAKRKGNFNELYMLVEKTCREIQDKLGVNVVRSVYGRGSKQGGELLKTNIKIAKKIAKKRKDGDPTYDVKKVRDIIGLTAVMQYPDQIDIFLEELSKRLEVVGLSIDHVDPIRRPGYYATHVDITSEVAPHLGLFCELQVKTMLHDAWAAKMHDLNYKPDGELDPRLDRMMQVIADTIESIEIQSQTLRELITERWHAEALWRKAARLRMFESMPAWLTSKEMMDGAALAVLEKMFKEKSSLLLAASDSDLLKNTQRDITRSCKKLPRDLWVLFSYLASLTGDTQACDFASVRISEWLGDIDEGEVGTNDLLHSDIYCAPLACSAFGDLDRAIEFSRTILDQFITLPDQTRMIVKWNLANFLVERQYFLPESSTAAAETKAEVEAILEECEPLRKDDPSGFFDFEGMMVVSFSNDPVEIKKAIKLIEKGVEGVKDEDMEFAEAFLELHSRMAWRRLLKLEAGL